MAIKISSKITGCSVVKERDEQLEGNTHKVHDSQGNAYYVVVNKEKDAPVEVFVNSKEQNEWHVAFGRVVSMALRWGVPVEVLAEELEGIRGPGWMPSVPSKVGEILVSGKRKGHCTSCGAKLIPTGKCSTCPSCGESKCEI